MEICRDGIKENKIKMASLGRINILTNCTVTKTKIFIFLVSLLTIKKYIKVKRSTLIHEN